MSGFEREKCMKLTKEQFKSDLKKRIQEMYANEINYASKYEIFSSLGALIQAYYSDAWKGTWKEYQAKKEKQVYYFSIEFLPGKMLKSNLLNIGILDIVRESLSDLEVDFEEICEVERDMALGNGGLGRLASCFMDSLASSSLPGNGNGIRYNYGLFKQKFLDGYQVELPDEWLRGGNVWEVRKEGKAVNVRYGGNVYLRENEKGILKPVYENEKIIRAVPYDTGMVGYKNNVVNTLRLWSAEIPESEENNYKSIEERRTFRDLTAVLYPDDSNYEGRLTRLIQEYFFVSAGIQSIVRHHKRSGIHIEDLHNYVAIHINDTHPALCVSELMRILIDEEEISWDKAWDITIKTMSYTNHTIMAEALEKWPVDMMKETVPRMFQIIEEIDKRFVEEMRKISDEELIEKTRIISNNQIHMAHLAIIGSHSTNGVAKLHSDLLKQVVLRDFYLIYPERFNNKTNGIAQRRWLQIANESLSQILDKTIGTSWRKRPEDLHLLMNFKNDDTFLHELAVQKKKNKQKLADFVKDKLQIKLNIEAIFDVQIKRLHAYKRQLLNLLHILKLYFDLKDNPEADIYPRVFIFGAKAAPSYSYAKTIIKCINEVAKIINTDDSLSDKLKVIFLENYNVSLAELIIPAADVSEQISLASKEASGTSNMKLMLNGALTIATLDGANIEIRNEVGEENIEIFGLTDDEVYDYYQSNNYSSIKIYEEDPILKRILNSFIDGTIPNIQFEGQEIFDSLIKYNDEFFVLRDFQSYVDAQKAIDKRYRDEKQWQKACLVNIASAGYFSSDSTVKKYAEDIWQINPSRNKGI